MDSISYVYYRSIALIFISHPVRINSSYMYKFHVSLAHHQAALQVV